MIYNNEWPYYTPIEVRCRDITDEEAKESLFETLDSISSDPFISFLLSQMLVSVLLALEEDRVDGNNYAIKDDPDICGCYLGEMLKGINFTPYSDISYLKVGKRSEFSPLEDYVYCLQPNREREENPTDFDEEFQTERRLFLIEWTQEWINQHPQFDPLLIEKGEKT